MFKINRKLLIISLILTIILANISYAQTTCEVSKVKQVLRKVLYLYFTEPKSSPLTLSEVKDLLIFYLSISDSSITADCSTLGSSTSKPVSDIITAGEGAADKIPTCADGTKYGECSSFRPKYCYSGSLIHRCNYCGCPSPSSCSTDGKCATTGTNITCFTNLDCGKSDFVGDYYCTDSWVVRNYVNYTCLNPGTASSSCAVSTSPIVLSYCNPNLNQVCVNGNNACSELNATTNQTTPTGVCLVRDSYTNVPVFSAPDLGKGYAKLAKAGINTISGLQSACSRTDFDNLLKTYCTINSNPIQEQVMTYDSQGNFQSLSCGAFGCDLHSCTVTNAINQTNQTNVTNQTLPAPLKTVEAGAYFGAGWPLAVYSQSIRFYYDANYLSKVSAFKVYQKKPGQSVFNLIGTFSNLSLLYSSCSGYVTFGSWDLRYICAAGFWEASSTGLMQPASYFPVGEYSYYVTAVDSSGGESAPSPLLVQYVLKPTTVLSPTSTQSPVSATPTIQWTVASGWPTGFKPSYYIQIYPESSTQIPAHYTTSVTVDPAQSTASKLYDGAAFDPNKKYIMEIRSGLLTSDRISYISMAEKVETFWTGNLTATNQTQTCTGVSKTVDFEDPPHLSFHLTWNPDLGTQDSYNYALDEAARTWLMGKGLVINGTPNGIVWGTRINGPVGATGVVIGDASPSFIESDEGISDNEILSVRFIDTLTKSVTAGLTVSPSNVSSINNVPATVVLEAYDKADNLVNTATKTFTGVTNSAYTPTTMIVSSSDFNIAKIKLRATQHPVGGVWLEDLNFLSCT